MNLEKTQRTIVWNGGSTFFGWAKRGTFYTIDYSSRHQLGACQSIVLNNTLYIPSKKNNKKNNVLTPLRQRAPLTSMVPSWKGRVGPLFKKKHVEPQHPPH
jgi:hypothetical protein